MKIRLYSLIIIFCVLFAAFMTSCRKNGDADDTDTNIMIETNETVDTALSTETESINTETVPVETDPIETVIEEELRVPVENPKAVEMIEYQYKKATEIIDWATNGTLATDTQNEIVTGDGKIYFAVTDSVARPELDGASIATFSDLSDYIRSVFARSLASDLINLASEYYTDVEGVLCREADYIDTEPTIPDEDIETDEVTDEAEEDNAPKVISTELFLSKFTDSMFRYTAKITYEKIEVAADPELEENAPDGEGETSEDNVEYFDFIFENTGGGWYWTEFPALPQ